MDFACKDIKLPIEKKEVHHGFTWTSFFSQKKFRQPAISGYHTELVSDISTAAAIATHKADSALGEEYASTPVRTSRFIPLQTLPMYLVMETEALSQPGFSALLEIVRSEDFRTILQDRPDIM